MSIPPRLPSIEKRMRQLILAFIIPAVIILVVTAGFLLFYARHYAELLHNVTTVSEFNQDFKDTIDLEMYYYVIQSQYSEGLPLEEVREAQVLASELSNTTTEKESRLAISSMLDLCKTLERSMLEIEQTDQYEAQQLQLTNNIYVLTTLIEEYMYTYLYHEAVYLNTLQELMTRQIVTVMLGVVVLAVGLILVLIRHVFRLANSITQPIAELCGRIESLSAGDLSVRPPVESHEYELRTLSEGVEAMVERLNTEVQENNRRMETLRQTELALLQAQINPHFLYNTMDTITWLIEARRTQEAVDMVSNLSSFFRHSLSKGEDIITLAAEEQQVKSYLQIQQVRYRDILAYTIDLDPALLNLRLPKLSLQPLVENALYHGIKMKRGVGHIRVEGRQRGEHIHLSVIDDGIGMKPERLQDIREAMLRGERRGFGLSTVHERIRLFFGPEYGLFIASEPGEGTTVTIIIPNPEYEGRLGT